MFIFVSVCRQIDTCVVGAATNKQHAAPQNTTKLDRETDELRHKKIPVEIGKLIQQGRNAKGLTQKDLATVRIITPLPLPKMSTA